jgi:hypothetical protein
MKQMNEMRIDIIPRYSIKVKQICGKVYYCYSGLAVQSFKNDFFLLLEKAIFDNELSMCNAKLINNLIKQLYGSNCLFDVAKKMEMYGTQFYDYSCCFRNNLLNSSVYILYYLYNNNYIDDNNEYNFICKGYSSLSFNYIFDIYVPKRYDILEKNIVYLNNCKKEMSVCVEMQSDKKLEDFDFKKIFVNSDICYVSHENKYGIFLF